MFCREKTLQPPDKFDFPFEPYHIQYQFMNNLYKVIENKKIGIFESPTGTGKSLSLTCGALKWLFDNEITSKNELTDKIKSLSIKVKEVDAVSVAGGDWITSQFQTIKEKEKLFDLKTIADILKEHDVKMKTLKERKMKEKEKKWTKRNMTKDKTTDDERLLLPDKEVNEDDFLIDDEEDDVDGNDNDVSTNEIPTHRTQIFYCSRTHSQLSQVVNEIKNTAYAKVVRVVSLASRQNYCINNSVNRLNSNALINERCIEMQKCKSNSSAATTVQDNGKVVKKSKLQSAKCPYYTQHSINSLRDSSLTDIMDIEEICGVGKDEKACPYYATRLAARDAHVILLPYQMLLHKRTRQQTGLNINNSVIIIDEAHNLLDTISNIYSAALTLDQFQRAHQQLFEYKNKYFHRFSAKNLLKINQLIFICAQLIKLLSLLPSTKESNSKQQSRMIRTDQLMMEGEFYNLKLNEILDFCEQTRLAQKVHGFSQKFVGIEIKSMQQAPPKPIDRKSYLQNLAEKQSKPQKDIKITQRKSDKKEPTASVESVEDQQKTPLQSSVIRPLLGFLECLLENAGDGRILINYSDGLKSKTIIKYLLLNPGAHFEEIVTKCRSLIIAGGTMQPTAEFTTQLFGTHIERIEEHFFGHVVPSDAVLPMAVSKGPTGRQFSFVFANRTNKDMLSDLAMTLRNVCSVVPAGVVCFFGSYDYMDMFYNFLNETGSLAVIQSKKTVFKEPRNSCQVDKMLQQYGQAAREPGRNGQIGGAFLLSVVGGKLSEGLNFADDLGRCVIVVGLPFPNKNSPELAEKLLYLDKTLYLGAGAEYYENICMKAVNQCIGRAVRHIKDYAAVLLLDERYNQEKIIKKLPKWIGGSLRCPTTYGLVQGSLAKFFRSKKGDN